MRFLAVLLALPPLTAFAQTFPINIQIAGRTDVTVGPRDCGTPENVTFSIPQLPAKCDDLRFWLSPASTCADAPTSTDRVVQTFSTPMSSGMFQIAVDDLPVFSLSDGGTTCGAPVEATFRLCAAFPHVDAFNTCPTPPQLVKATNPPTITYDGKPPEVPTITNVASLDSSLSVAVDVDEDTQTVIVTAVGQTNNDRHEAQRSAPITSPVIVDGLTNGQTYTVTARARDLVGNESAESPPESGTPVATAGFFEACVKGGACPAQSGCSATGAATPLTLLVVAAGGMILRRREVR